CLLPDRVQYIEDGRPRPCHAPWVAARRIELHELTASNLEERFLGVRRGGHQGAVVRQPRAGTDSLAADGACDWASYWRGQSGIQRSPDPPEVGAEGPQVGVDASARKAGPYPIHVGTIVAHIEVNSHDIGLVDRPGQLEECFVCPHSGSVDPK